MHLIIKLVEYSSWIDSRLAYEKNPNVSSSLKNSRLDLSSVRYNIWRPNVGYTELNRLINLTEIVYLYPNGTIYQFKEILLTLTCNFDYTNIPSDEHSCHTTAYMQNEFSDTGVLQFVDKFPKGREKQHLSW